MILPYIFNTIWWTSLFFIYIGSDMGHWPVFHDLAILNHLTFSAFWSFVDGKYLWMYSKVRNRPVVYSRHEVGASMYFGHIPFFFFFGLTLASSPYNSFLNSFSQSYLSYLTFWQASDQNCTGSPKSTFFWCWSINANVLFPLVITLPIPYLLPRKMPL